MILYVLGTIAANVVGKRLIHLAERVVDQIPVVKVVYSSAKKVLETFAGDESRGFQRVVLVSYPSKQMRSIGLVTHVAQDQQTGETIYGVYVALAPHLTSGFLFLVPASEVVELDWSVEQALKVIISGGMLMPVLGPVGFACASDKVLAPGKLDWDVVLISLIKIKSVIVLRNLDVNIEICFDAIPQRQRGLLLAVTEENFLGLLLEMSQPMEQARSVCVG